MAKYQDRFRVESARLPGWDYASVGWYFVTICTRDRVTVLGDVIDGKMQLSSIGEIVADEWQKTPQVRPNVTLDEWVIMPNHIHGIIVIETPQRGTGGPADRLVSPGHAETPQRGVSTLAAGSLGAIIGQIKAACTKRIWAAGRTDFAWQMRFYDHIIRDPISLRRIREYIASNPARWMEDKDNPANLWV